MLISYIVSIFFEIIIFLMLVRVLLSWFPRVPWYKEPFKTLRAGTDVIFEPFRKIIPPFGMLDISPIVAFLAISLIQFLVVSILSRYGL